MILNWIPKWGGLLRQLIKWEQVLHIRKYYRISVKLPHLIIILWFSTSCSKEIHTKVLRGEGA